MRSALYIFLFFLHGITISSQNDTTAINKLNNQSYLFRRTKPDSALLTGQQALNLALKAGDHKRTAVAYNNVGMAYFFKNKYDSALAFVKLSLQTSAGSGNQDGIGMSYYNLGLINRFRAAYAESITDYYSALKIYEAMGNEEKVGDCYNDLGNVYYAQQNYARALEQFTVAMPIIEKLNPKKVSNLYLNLGLVYSDLKKFDKAKEYFFKALKLREAAGSPLALADVYTNIGVCLLGEGSANQSAAKKDLAMKNFEEALSYHLKAAGVYEKFNNEFYLGLSYSNIGDSYMRLGKYGEASSYLNRSLSMAMKVKDLEGIKYIYSSLLELYSLTGDYKKAFEYSRKYILLKDSLMDQKNQNQISEIQTRYETDKKDKEITILNKDKQLQESIIEKQDAQRAAFITGIVFLLGFLIFVFRSYSQKKKANVIITGQKLEVEKQKHIIEEKNKDIMDSITYARRIQQAMLPSRQFIREALPGSFVLYMPKDIVAGDFYWSEVVKHTPDPSQLSSPDSQLIFVAAADCTGHGVPGAMVSVVCSNALHRTVQEFGITDTGLILGKTRELVIQTFERSGEEVKDGMDISLCSVLRAPGSDRSIIQWSGANNPLWYIKNGELKEIKADKQPIGRFSGQAPFTAHSIELGKGDCLYIFTDGYPDQFGGDKGKKLKYKPFQELLLSIKDLDPDDQRKKLEAAFTAWRGIHEQVDDVCVIGIRF